MMYGKLQIQKCHPEAKTPDPAYQGDAGFDLFATEPTVLVPGKVTKVPLGFKTAFQPSLVALLMDKSGNAAKGIFVQGGVIDSNYRGEWVATLYNATPDPINVSVGQGVCQVLLLPRFSIPVEIVDDLPPSPRAGGFGSSNRGIK